MDTATHDLNTLFAQLGLANSDDDIEDFIHQHGGQLAAITGNASRAGHAVLA